jgi:hypothetical protein
MHGMENREGGKRERRGELFMMKRYCYARRSARNLYLEAFYEQ